MRKLLIFLAAISIVAVIVVCCYGMGSDIVSFAPAWLTNFLVGTISCIVLAIIVGIFVAGILHIRDLFKEG